MSWHGRPCRRYGSCLTELLLLWERGKSNKLVYLQLILFLIMKFTLTAKSLIRFSLCSNSFSSLQLSHALTLPIGMMVFMAVLGMKKMTVQVVPSTANCLVRKLWAYQNIIVATASEM